MLKNNNSGMRVLVTSTRQASRRLEPSSEAQVESRPTRIKQSIEDLKIDDIEAFIDELKTINDVKEVLKQLLYLQRIDKEITVTHKIKGRRNANPKRPS